MDNTIRKNNSVGINTLIKFSYDSNTKTHLAFVTKLGAGKPWKGCRENAKTKKKIVIPSKEIASTVQDNTLYHAELIPMNNDQGFIATKLEIQKFPAVIETTVSPTRFKCELKFGNKTIIYDPQKGRQESRKLLPNVMELVRQRVDIENKDKVMEDFNLACQTVLYYYIEYKKGL